MKTLFATLLIGAGFLAAANAQAPVNPNTPDRPQTSISTGTTRDGFFLRNSKVYMIRNGVTTVVDREMDFPNGIRVLPDGTITLRDGTQRTLLTNQWLDFQGLLQDFSPTQPATHSTNSAATQEIGISNRDGISVSGADVFITRNGVSDKVNTDVHLPNGVIVKPDGTVLLGNGKKITLRAEQVLSLDGVLHEAPVPPNRGGGIEPSTNAPR